MRFMVLSTGSKGNCTYVATAHAQVLIDCGIGVRSIESILSRHGINFREIDAVLVSHLHSDHTRGLSTLLKQVPARVYAHHRMKDALEHKVLTEMSGAKRAKYSSCNIVGFNGGDGFPHRDLDILPVHVSHDCDPTVSLNCVWSELYRALKSCLLQPAVPG